MQEDYRSFAANLDGGFGVARVEATTRYKGYLRFGVTTEEKIGGPPPQR
jgi:hypothetical protein